VVGVDPYEFTSRFLAWAAERAASGEISGRGALGPVEAFGLDVLLRGVRECGMEVRGTGLAESSPVTERRSSGKQPVTATH
jgi:hypothetical protein